MVKDYSGSYVAKNGKGKKNSRKKKATSKSSEFFSATKLMWKTLGAILLVTVIIGTTSTIWYGWQIQQALDQIGRDKMTHSELASENGLLIAQRNLMLTQKHMEKAAQRVGLYSPTKGQLRYP